MGSGEEGGPVAKPSKQVASTQESPTTHVYPDWPSMQAYYNGGATHPAFFTPSVPSSHSPHAYLWGNQHFMPPYGTPLPYPAMYPHGGLYTHPNMAMAQTPPPATETEGKVPKGKEQGSKKKSKGNSGTAGGKSGDSGKDSGKSGPSGNDGGTSQSAESGSEGSSNTSNENAKQRDASKKRSFHRILADGANEQNTSQYSGVDIESSLSARGQPAANPVSVSGKPVTNLNIGMDLWNASPAGSVPSKTRPNSSVAPTAMVGCEGAATDHMWIQDERELKRQRRKQSNRESARRSRLRKQAECEELQEKVERLSNDNHMLKEELKRLSEECLRLTNDNSSIMEELKQAYGPDSVSSLEIDQTQAANGETNNHKQESAATESDSVSEEKGSYFKSNGGLAVDPN